MDAKTEKWPAYNVERRAVSALKPYKGNARTHSDTQIAQIAASIQEWGWTTPILIDEKGGVIAGHGRLLAAKELGAVEVPVVIARGWSKAQKRAYVLADNQLALNAGWDEDLLRVELGGLGEMSFDTSLLGFGDEFLANLFADKNAGLTDPDEVPPTPVNAVTVLGDVWVLGRHRVMCGDSTSVDAVDRLMPDERADMVFTDPPYGVEYQSNMRTKSAKFDVLKNDDTELDIAPIIEAFSIGWVFIWTTWKVLDKWLGKTAAFGYPSNMVVWAKGGGGIGDLKKTFSTDYEIALVFNRGAELQGKRIGSVWNINKDGAVTYQHPTQKPVALAQEAIDKTTRAGNMVLDLFGGSGSTLIACETTGRASRLMEIDPRYCDVIINRWQNFTGNPAILEGDGRTFEQVGDERYDQAKDAAASYDAAIEAKRTAKASGRKTAPPAD